MPKAHNPRRGSMQVWPRKRAKRIFPRISSWADGTGLLGFAGFKVGMTHVIATDPRKNSATKGEDLSLPATIIECPPMRIAGVRFYRKGYDGKEAMNDILAPNKDLNKRLTTSKNPSKLPDSLPADCSDVVVLVQTQPKLTGIGKKVPEIFEIAIGGSNEDKFNFAKENLGKELSVKDVLKEGQFIDIHAITTGKGHQGSVKRFGVKIRAKKAEKTKRGPGSLGGWKGHAHFMYRVAFPGQMGFHSRVDYNKRVLKIGDNPEDVNPKGGFIRYGNVKSQFILVHGSIPGPKKRLIRMRLAARPDHRKQEIPFTIQHINTESMQGR
ncbi:50S ribosomal protein L3 [Nanoarchaeota archaeon]